MYGKMYGMSSVTPPVFAFVHHCATCSLNQRNRLETSNADNSEKPEQANRISSKQVVAGSSPAAPTKLNMTTSNTPPVTPERIMQFAWGYVPPLVLEAAIKNRVFDTLDAGPKTIGEVQAATGASERGLAAIMNALVGLNFLAKDGQGRYSLAPESAAFLVSTKPAYQGGLISHCSQHLIPKWLRLNDIVRTGKPVEAVNQETTGAEFFQKFVTDLFPMNYASAQTLAKHLAVNSPAQVLDLAAGSAVWGIALAQSSENVRVTAVIGPM